MANPANTVTWSASCPNGKVVLTANQVTNCVATFTQEPDPINPGTGTSKACINDSEEIQENGHPDKYSVTLTSCSTITSGTTHNWLLYTKNGPYDYDRLTDDVSKSTIKVALEKGQDYIVVLQVTDGTDSNVIAKEIRLSSLVDFIAEPNANRIDLTASVIGKDEKSIRYYWWDWNTRNSSLIGQRQVLKDQALSVGEHVITLMAYDDQDNFIGAATKVVTILEATAPIFSLPAPTVESIHEEGKISLKFNAIGTYDPDNISQDIADTIEDKTGIGIARYDWEINISGNQWNTWDSAKLKYGAGELIESANEPSKMTFSYSDNTLSGCPSEWECGLPKLAVYYYLKITDDEESRAISKDGSGGPIFIVRPNAVYSQLPILGQSLSFKSSGLENGPAGNQFRGGAFTSTRKSIKSKDAVFSVEDEIEILAHISVDAAHEGEKADKLIVIGKDPASLAPR